MARFNPSLPENYLTDDNGQIVQVTPEEYQKAKASGGLTNINQDKPDHTAAYSMIDEQAKLFGWTPDEVELAKLTVDQYSGGIEADAPAILDTFGKIKANTIDPHYADLINQATYGLKQNISALEKSRETELEAERLRGQQDISGAEKSLEMSGLSNTGEKIMQLGGQVPFGGGEVFEGAIPQANRLIATDTQNRYLENIKNQMNRSEQLLGTAGVQGVVGLPKYAPIGGVRGSIHEERLGKEGETLTDIASIQEAKRKYIKEQPNPVTPLAITK